MASEESLHATEAEMRRLLDREGLPQPDEVEHLEGAISLRWHEQRHEVLIDEIPDDLSVDLG